MSANKAYVGNLPFSFTQVDLQELFQGFGPVRSAQIITDRETGRSRGFGFVEMETAEALQQAIAGLHERNVQGRNLTVNEARERAPGAGARPSGGFRPAPAARPIEGAGFGGDSKPRFGKGGGPKDRRERGGDGEGDYGRVKRSKARGYSDDERG
jgi:RNA recognition motif-containing protein